MTGISFNMLMDFLDTHKIKGRIADYGGTMKIGGGHVIKALRSRGLTDYHMLDYDSGIDLLKPIKGKKFDVGICMDLFEHTTQPFKIAKNIKDSLKRGAWLFVTAPFIWEIHNYPGDYWRFTPQGLNELFLGMDVEYVGLVRDQTSDEVLPRSRVVGIFRKK